MLTSSDRERIQAIMTDIWVEYPVAQHALSALEDLLEAPRNARTENLLIVARSGNGKTSVVHRFVSLHPARYFESEGRADIPVVVVDMPPEPSETRFWSQMLSALRIAHADSASPQRKMSQAFRVLEEVKSAIVVIDDVHNVLAGNIRQQKHFLNVIKEMSIQLRLPLVAVGTEDALHTLRSDRQLFSRFTPFPLPAWQLDRDWLSLLAAFENSLPLAQPSELASREMAPLLLSKSNATIGGLAWTLRRAAVAAIRDRSERITLKSVSKFGSQTAEDFAKVTAVL